MDCYCDYEPAEFFQSSKPRARKEHRCYECGGRILPGEQYEYVVGKWSGDFSSFKTCERCHDIRKWVENNVPCACWAYGNLDEDAKETINDAYCRAPKETVGLRFGLLRRIVARDRFNKSRRAALRAAEQERP